MTQKHDMNPENVADRKEKMARECLTIKGERLATNETFEAADDDTSWTISRPFVNSKENSRI
ncbi:unnamed protein product [Haemonchus placei]|uniref:Sulfur oxidation protein SoxZ n=1 Tax=Haemonchus placei TaxID=6290 RepID=A0A0N4VV54_HAEPC|nr:unnamed protein product [Haemonchus placei]